MRKVLIFIGGVLSLSSCKKDHVCECINPSGVFDSFSIHDTKKKAEDKCADYAKQYQTGLSETGCRIK
jgi:hypothetical protein